MSVVAPSPEDLQKKEALYQKILVHRESGKELTPEEHKAIQQELADLIVVVPILGAITLKQLVKAALVGVVGFLYNTGASHYVNIYSQEKWLAASKSTKKGAVQWKFYIDSTGNKIFEAKLKGISNYLSWTGIMGQCEMKPKYAKTGCKDWANKTFVMYNVSNGKGIGTWSETNDIMYNRTNVKNFEWEFVAFNHPEFKEIDHLIVEAHADLQ